MKKKLKKLLTIMSFLCVLFICASIGTPEALSKELVLASLVPMSGGGAAWGIACDRAVRMWADEINTRGGSRVGNEIYTFKIVTMDHRYVPGEALGAAKRAVSEGIKFAVGHGGGVMPAMQPVLEENKVIYMGSIGGGVEFTNAKCPYTFRTFASSDVAYYVFLPKLVEILGSIKAGFLYSNDELGRADEKAAERVIKGRNLPIEKLVEFVERDAVDFSPVVTRLMVKGVNCVFVELTPAQTPTFIKQAWELGYKGRIGILRATHSLEALVQAAGKEALEGFISGQNWPPGKYPSARFETIRSKYLSLYKEEAVNILYYVYAGMEFLGLALEKAGTTDTGRVVKVMYDLKTETVLGPTSMVGKSLGYGINTQMSYSIPLCEVRDGRLKLIDVFQHKE
jgi:branched-chain amino acid transport system substrate-binding protein